MSYLHLVPREEIADRGLAELATQAFRRMEFIPSTLQVLAGSPGLARGYLQLTIANMRAEKLDNRVRFLAALVSSRTAQCRYCTAHAARFAAMTGSSVEVIRAAVNLDFSDKQLFPDGDVAVCRLAQAASVVPNEVTRDHFDGLAAYFSEEQVLEMISMISFMGFLNRFNDSVASPLEPDTLAFAEKHLAGTWWTPGRHATAEPVTFGSTNN